MRIRRQASLAIGRVTGLDHIVLYVPADAVLWTKQRRDIDVRMFVKQVRDVAKAVIDRCLITNQTDTCALQQFNSLMQKVFDSENDTKSSLRIQ